MEDVMRENWDAIVIGSGIGGLSVAALLARVADKKVLVLEKHTEPGGFTHVFRRDGASWDVGLHYIGGLDTGRLERDLFDFITGGDLDWNRMPEEFERFVYPGFTFSVPSDPKLYEQRLIERYPDERTAISRYFKDVRRTAAWYVRRIQKQMMPAPAAAFIDLWQFLSRAKATQTTGAYIDSHFRSPELKALLTSQWGDYGLPPKDSAFALHALVAASYFDGAWFPAGGAGRIAHTIEPGIAAHGGTIKVCQEVTSILIENGRAVGVRVIDHTRREPEETTCYAPVIVSDVGAPLTYLELLPTTGEIGEKTAGIRSLIAPLSIGVSAVSLYVRLSKPVSSLGIEGENYWINTSLAHDDVAAITREVMAGRPRQTFLSFPSAKSGDDRFHTAEIITMIDPTAFATWKDSEPGHRSVDYQSLKQRIADGLIRLADTAVPGLADLVTYAELSTPLSVEHFTSHPSGRFYGLAGTPQRYRAEPLRARTPLPGLFLTGSDISSPGIVGALIGGLVAACQIIGGIAFFRIMSQMKQPRLPATPARADESRHRVTLKAKTALTPKIWRLDYALDAEVEIAPGQYGKLQVGPFEWRCYSIANLTGRHLTLLVSNRTRGDGSHYADSVEPGDTSLFEMPLGTYRLEDNAHRKVFVATGTGLAPFLPMFRALAEMGQLHMAELYFGCRTPDDDITKSFAEQLPTTIRCFSRSDARASDISGRVTKAMEMLDFDPETTDFYICGGAAMVADCRKILENSGAINVLTEPY